MQLLHHICLEAVSSSHNIFRFFNIHIGQNLFGEPELVVNNGRIGTKGRIRILKFEDEGSRSKKLRQLVLKRINAHTRIGCSYIIRKTTLDPEMLQTLTSHKRSKRRTRHYEKAEFVQ